MAISPHPVAVVVPDSDGSEGHYFSRLVERVDGLTAIPKQERGLLQRKYLMSNFEAIFVRHQPPWASTDCEDPLPTISQHENPLAWSARLRGHRHYLTDLSYMPFFRSAEEQFTLPIRLMEPDVLQKEFDVLFIGTPRSVSIAAKLISRPYVNDFRGMGDIARQWEHVLGLDRSLRLRKSWRNASGEYQRRVLDAIRAERRSRIIRELVGISREGVRVAVVGYSSLGPDSRSNNLDYLGDWLSWSDVEAAIRKSRLTVCTTPNHTSILNERLVACIEMDSVPLIEPFPQNQTALGDLAKSLTFDYGARSIGECIRKNLEAFDETHALFQAQRRSLETIHSKSAVQTRLSSAVRRAQELQKV